MSRPSLVSAAALTFALAACAGPAPHDATTTASSGASGSERVATAATATAATTTATTPTPAPVHATSLTRHEVEQIVAGGLGRLLARVELSPVLERGRFVGFRLENAEDLPAWNAAGMDVHPGDVIVRVNGMRVDRPEQAFAAFERLRIVPAIEVDLLRDGAPRTARSVIRD